MALLGVGRHAPRPPGLRPLARLRAPGPCCLCLPMGRVPGTGAPGGRGGQPLAVVHAGRPAPLLPLVSVFQRPRRAAQAGRGLGGRAPPGRETVGNPAQAVGGQGAAAGCARRPRTGRGCPRATGPQGAAPAPPGTRRRRRSALCIDHKKARQKSRYKTTGCKGHQITAGDPLTDHSW